MKNTSILTIAFVIKEATALSGSQANAIKGVSEGFKAKPLGIGDTLMSGGQSLMDGMSDLGKSVSNGFSRFGNLLQRKWNNATMSKDDVYRRMGKNLNNLKHKGL